LQQDEGKNAAEKLSLMPYSDLSESDFRSSLWDMKVLSKIYCGVSEDYETKRVL